MTTNFQLAREVAKHVELRTVCLATAQINSSIDPLDPPENVKLSQEYRCRFAHEQSDDKQRIRVFADFRFMADRPDAEESSKGLVRLEATFQLVYEVPSNVELNATCVEQFAEVNGPYNAWPYWRELVQSATGRVGLVGVTIPVYRPGPRELAQSDEAAGAAGGLQTKVSAS